MCPPVQDPRRGLCGYPVQESRAGPGIGEGSRVAAMQLTRTHRILIGVVVAGALIIAAIGFAGSYAAVRELAEQKGFGDFSLVFPIGIDAGICVLLALDLLLTWMRIPFPLLRQTAWLLTFATIAFNGAAAWPDPLGVGMHAVIPILFVVAVEAARHAVGRIADITADKHMEGVRLTRWLLSPVPTFKLWRRMKLWELRSYEQVIKLEQDRLIYQARLQARFGRSWRRKAPIEALMPLRLAKFGVPLAQTAPAGLAAAGIEPVLLPPAPVAQATAQPEMPADG
ncbi:integral membrane protein [Streptomyces pristinaespiralis ATCC 25486]|uniref:Integral membrane protein n=1 Tax=Streptomyces pristinaespiralis (strain ATCC 25486 / DSM 40338 / CBS 914.69 / JCM 4507 / KCC S-0507 / NBRC 13074 / NRRL 2958 / 5647) TaxID=457429 RepID=B5HHJ7_STRE2|nr:integral membrane protein [Streptomyces pristinaespiralis ATCC 25486]